MAGNQKVFWGRTGYIAIEGRDGKFVNFGGITGDSLDFKFDGSLIGDISPTFTAGIRGLSKEHIEQLTGWNPAETLARARQIRVYAGYQKDGISRPLFDGIIREAIPTSPPDMWLNFRCMMNFKKIAPIDKPEVITKESLSTIFGRIADKCGMNWRWNATQADGGREVNFTMEGTPQDLASTFADRFDLMVYADGDTLIAEDRRPWRGTVKNPHLVDIENGLLNIGGLTIAGATVVTRLNTRIKMCDWVRLSSTLNPKANGDYVVIKVHHKGHLRGDEWTTTLKMIRREI
jgi:hypothetical protein